MSDATIAKIEGYITDALMEMSTAEETQPTSQREFRASGLPFCPILSFLKSPRTESYGSTHYTSTGTAIHLTVQTWLAKTKLSSRHLFGNWLCTGCGDKKSMCKKPQPCPCKSSRSLVSEFHRRMRPFWMYEEIEFEWRGMSGHCDMVYWPEPDFAFVGDFKTTDLVKKKQSSFFDPAKPSSPTYIPQIRTYCTILDLQYSVPIRGWSLINLNRAAPYKKPSDAHLLTSIWDHKKSVRWDRILELASKNNKRLTKLEQAIEAEDSGRARELLTNIVVNRPCTTQKEYNQWMAYAFFKGECELKKDCLSCKINRIKKSVLSRLNELD